MIDRSHDLSLTRQAQLMRISRGSVYYRRKPADSSQVQLMHRLDALHMAHRLCGLSHAQGLATTARALRGAQAYTYLDAAYTHSGAVPQTPHQCSPSAAQDLPLSAQTQNRSPRQSGLGYGDHLRAHAQGLDVLVCRGRLVQPQGAGLATV